MKQKRMLWAAAVGAVGLLLILAVVWKREKAETVLRGTEQESWHIFTTERVPEGLRVQTVGENLLLSPGIRVLADSLENRSFPARAAVDGNHADKNVRWSSQNDWEQEDHWLQVVFPQQTTVGAARIYWERANALEYALEYSADGKNWICAAAFTGPPESTVQDLVLERPVEAKALRLHVTAVKKEESDLSLYYRNVSVLELEAYAGIEADFLLETPRVPAGSRRQLGKDGGRIPYPAVPEGFSLEFLGADYEMLVDHSGRIADNEAEVEVELGFALVKDGVSRELPGIPVSVPAASGEGAGGDAVFSELPALLEDSHVMEWVPFGGEYEPGEALRLRIAEEENPALADAAELFASELSALTGTAVPVVLQKDGETREQKGDILLTLQDWEETAPDWPDGLGEEGYRIEIGGQDGGIRILGGSTKGLRWGCVTLLSLLEKGETKLPAGRLTDYPRYPVRGFGIDVGRRPVSLDFLYRLVEELSRRKMNTLLVHLNDNQIIATSGYDGTLEGARSLYAGFRLESDLHNGTGEGITSRDLFYTKEEFSKFIRDAAVYGIDVVPEIDTPAHSLALTKVFPKLGLSRNPESADQLDLKKPEAVQLGKDLWTEYLEADGTQEAVFGACRAVHIGMDEYFGDEEAFLSYLTQIADHVGRLAPEKQIRAWGSLSRLQTDYGEVPRTLQLHIWNTDWADPQEMYEAGFGIINSLSSHLYLIPGGGEYDRLDIGYLEKEWQPNLFETAEQTWILPAWSDRMLGACYMMWNDWQQADGMELTQDDLMERFLEPLPAIAQKCWG